MARAFDSTPPLSHDLDYGTFDGPDPIFIIPSGLGAGTAFGSPEAIHDVTLAVVADASVGSPEAVHQPALTALSSGLAIGSPEVVHNPLVGAIASGLSFPGQETILVTDMNPLGAGGSVYQGRVKHQLHVPITPAATAVNALNARLRWEPAADVNAVWTPNSPLNTNWT